MASENRQIPKSNIKRQAALNTGRAKNTAMGGSSWITAATVTLLIFIQPLYDAAMNAINTAKAVFFNANSTKDAKAASCEMVCSHFVQVFFMAVKRGVYNAGDLAYYGLTANGEVPDMSTDAKILAVAKKLILGDAARMAVSGAVAMANPSIGDVTTAKSAFETSITAQNTANETVKAAQAVVVGYNTQADNAIKLLWTEVETKFTNSPAATMRAEARLWGVIYNRVGSTKIVTGKVTDSATGGQIIGASIYFENGNNDATSTDAGYTLDTTLMDVQKLIATHPLYNEFDVMVTLVENENIVVDIVMVRI